MEELSTEKLASLEKMRSAFKDADGFGVSMDDSTFLRYLKARNFQFDKASTMLNATLKWRKEIGISDLKSWMDIIRHENSTGKTYCRGYDKAGHSILYMKPGHENSKDHEGNIKHLVFNMEKTVTSGMSRSNPMWKVFLIIDYKGYSMANAPPMKTSMEVLSILQNHYPETLHRAYLVNPPWIFHALYNMIYPFIDPVTKEKIHMLSGSKESIREKFSREVDLDVLESDFGGNDSRPFISEKYLSAPFETDYYTYLNFEETSSSSLKSDTTTAAAAVTSENVESVVREPSSTTDEK